MSVLILSLLPFWESSTDVTYFYIGGSGDPTYATKKIFYSSSDLPHGDPAESSYRRSSRVVGWGAYAGVRRNEWSLEARYDRWEPVYWEAYGGTVTSDPTTQQEIQVSLRRHASTASFTNMGVMLGYYKYQDSKVGTDYVSTEVSGNIFTVGGQLFMEKPEEEPGMGFMPWVGGNAGFFLASYWDENGYSSDAMVPIFTLEVGLKWRPWSWLDLWSRGGASVMSTKFKIPETQQSSYEYVSYDLSRFFLQVGATLTYTRGIVY